MNTFFGNDNPPEAKHFTRESCKDSYRFLTRLISEMDGLSERDRDIFFQLVNHNQEVVLKLIFYIYERAMRDARHLANEAVRRELDAAISSIWNDLA